MIRLHCTTYNKEEWDTPLKKTERKTKTDMERLDAGQKGKTDMADDQWIDRKLWKKKTPSLG